MSRSPLFPFLQIKPARDALSVQTACPHTGLFLLILTYLLCTFAGLDGHVGYFLVIQITAGL